MKLVAPMQLRGAAAEQRAADFLCTKGYKILARNFSCRYGEIDLVTQHRGWLVFIEVKYRRSTRFGTAVDAITYSKLRRLQAAAATYQQLQHSRRPFRFEFVAIDDDEHGQPQIQHLTSLA